MVMRGNFQLHDTTMHVAPPSSLPPPSHPALSPLQPTVCAARRGRGCWGDRRPGRHLPRPEGIQRAGAQAAFERLLQGLSLLPQPKCPPG